MTTTGTTTHTAAHLIATAPRYTYSRDMAQDTINQARFAALDDFGSYSRGGLSASEWTEMVEGFEPDGTLYARTYTATLAALIATMGK